MNPYNDLLVASIALIGSFLALAISLGPWTTPYRLRSISHVVDRYGMPAARCVWIMIALVSLFAGVAIAGGFRPSFAKPAGDAVDSAR
ncbi:MAG: hypothetical protein AAF745_14235 [Planctomycetota bacterium]